MATRIELTKRDTNTLVRQYNNGASLSLLAEDFGFSIPVIRRMLVEAGATIRPAGRPAQG